MSNRRCLKWPKCRGEIAGDPPTCSQCGKRVYRLMTGWKWEPVLTLAEFDELRAAKQSMEMRKKR